MRDDDHRHQRGEQFDGRITQRNSPAACSTFTALKDITENRDILLGRDRRFTVRTARARDHQVEYRQWFRNRVGYRRARIAGLADGFGCELATLLAPLALHHQRQSINDDVQKTADQQPEHEGHHQRDRGMTLKIINQHRYFELPGTGAGAAHPGSERHSSRIHARCVGGFSIAGGYPERRARLRRPGPS